MEQVLDARGLACPLPVINTKNALESLVTGDQIEVRVDNEIAVQNLQKFAAQRGHGFESKKLAADDFAVVLTKGQETAAEQPEEPIVCATPRGRALVVLSSSQMGQGEEALGRALMKAFVFALTKQDQMPETVIMYNSGAFLSCEGSDSVEDLRYLESQGTEILTCGTCLNFYGLTEKLAVGGVTNMYDIVERMERAEKVIRP